MPNKELPSAQERMELCQSIHDDDVTDVKVVELTEGMRVKCIRILKEHQGDVVANYGDRGTVYIDTDGMPTVMFDGTCNSIIVSPGDVVPISELDLNNSVKLDLSGMFGHRVTKRNDVVVRDVDGYILLSRILG